VIRVTEAKAQRRPIATIGRCFASLIAARACRFARPPNVFKLTSSKRRTLRRNIMSYIDGFVIPVPAGKKEAYRKMAETAAPLFKEYGAIRMVECWGNDVPDGKVTDFKRAVKAEAGENIVFSWIVWPSKKVRDAGNKKMMEDPRMKMTDDMPFDPRRMIFGGFEVLVDTGKE
jgi:uncharacterized protein YbaA (DUF1428 family)